MAAGRDVTAEVKRIIKEQLDVDESDIKPESVFIDDLGADSLGLVELVLAFEEAFELEIPDEETIGTSPSFCSLLVMSKPRWKVSKSPSLYSSKPLIA